MAAAQSRSNEPSDPDVHPALRNALRLTLSAREYKLLHDHVIKRCAPIRRHAPSPSRYEAIVHSKEHKYNIAALRAALRVFLLTSGGLSLYDYVIRKIRKVSRTGRGRAANLRVALSFSLALFLHRILRRFFIRLRASLLTDDAKPFRDRNPRVSWALTSRYAAAVGASLAALALGICPLSRLRAIIATYFAIYSLESLYNVADLKGLLWWKPRWFGSWLLMPVSCAQLFHAFIFDRETIPKWIGDLLLKYSPTYVLDRPDGFTLYWPPKTEIIDSLGSIADLRWPLFISPILHPNKPDTLPRRVLSISVVTSSAHPGIGSLSCALLHPSTPSCGKAFIHHLLTSIPLLARTITLAMVALSALRYKAFSANPIGTMSQVAKRIVTLTGILSASLGSLWGSICLLNSWLPRSTLPTKRFFLGGFLGGLPFAFVGKARGLFLYIFRTAIQSAWATGVKRGLWRGSKGGDLAVLVLSWAVMGAILDGSPQAIRGPTLRKSLAWLRGEGFVDMADTAARRRRRAS
ncbi:hypothetical protein VTN31DRAFT_3179 [Thermomyces dupontii]|uniref:uncharacterized protein n=1 Tax=Talaromyces thermophilus TaxID=28565 RepID=UPI00374357A1